MADLVDTPAVVLNKAVQTYSQDPAFLAQITRIEEQYRLRMRAIVNGTLSAADREALADDSEEDGVTADEPMGPADNEQLFQYLESATNPHEEPALQEEIDMATPRSAYVGSANS